uniref:Uncharacterized protein n=1 Tax=Triticum urartu TaxID=4572 RepID=A0A8R7R3N1_TRIUA
MGGGFGALKTLGREKRRWKMRENFWRKGVTSLPASPPSLSLLLTFKRPQPPQPQVKSCAHRRP